MCVLVHVFRYQDPEYTPVDESYARLASINEFRTAPGRAKKMKGENEHGQLAGEKVVHSFLAASYRKKKEFNLTLLIIKRRRRYLEVSTVRASPGNSASSLTTRN